MNATHDVEPMFWIAIDAILIACRALNSSLNLSHEMPVTSTNKKIFSNQTTSWTNPSSFSLKLKHFFEGQDKDLVAIRDDITRMHSDLLTQIRAAYRAAVKGNVIDQRILQRKSEVILKKLVLRFRHMYDTVLNSRRLRGAVLSMSAS